jgi:hypothetical protein
VDPAPRYFADLTLTDQFGRSYQARGGSGTTQTDFEPLAGPASVLGGRLTLHVARLSLTQGPSAGQRVPPHVDGDWRFHFTLVPRQAHQLPLPRPLEIGDTKYTFTSVQAASIMAVKIRVSGGAVERWNAVTASRVPGPMPPDVFSYYQTELYDVAGRRQPESYGEFGGDSINVSWVLQGPGRYRLHVGDPKGGTDVWFTVLKD